ncbi:MAG: 5-formyltetrahydrofolate cyclo-ligase [Sulfuricellaceae bacterium]|nr:5-formyltetrahydrofolate cyclo-ligase [Sulfuricellaceae bacterium]
MNKRELRRVLRAKRREIPPAERRRAAQRLQRLARPLLLRYRRIGFYLANDGEMDLLPLLNQALRMKRACFLPIVPPPGQLRLRFGRLSAVPDWYHNRFGIPEHNSAHQVRASRLDVLFVPLVGFDAQGNRLGMGGGFYDASLAYLHPRLHWRKPRLIGVGFECQKTGPLPRDPWDAPLDAVITEAHIYRFPHCPPE